MLAPQPCVDWNLCYRSGSISASPGLRDCILAEYARPVTSEEGWPSNHVIHSQVSETAPEHVAKGCCTAVMISIFMHMCCLFTIKPCWAQLTLEGHGFAIKLLPHIVVNHTTLWPYE